MKQIYFLIFFASFFLMSSCSEENSEGEPAKKESAIEDEISRLIDNNNEISKGLPILQDAADTLIYFMTLTKQSYLQDIFLKQASEIKARSERGKKEFSSNKFRIEMMLQDLRRFRNEPIDLTYIDSLMQYDSISRIDTGSSQ